MGKTFERLDEDLQGFIRQQHVFFIATAPDDPSGTINLSPKGLDALRIIDEHTVAYLDLIGSGIETVAHLRDNGRFTLLFCAFDGPPKILRLQGKGKCFEKGDAGFDRLAPLFPDHPGKRSIVVLDVDRIGDSCGWGVPLYEYQRERSTLTDWAARTPDEKIRKAQLGWNMESVDGLPGLSKPSV